MAAFGDGGLSRRPGGPAARGRRRRQPRPPGRRRLDDAAGSRARLRRGGGARGRAPARAGPAAPAASATAERRLASSSRLPEVAPAESAAGRGSVVADWLVIDLGAPDPQAIVRLLRRDGRTMNALVDRLAGSDPAARIRLAAEPVQFRGLRSSPPPSTMPASTSRPGNPFWDQFPAAESREIARGLAALGFRYDGFEAFVDGRVPSHRDLALAVGQVGLLPVKVRHWPSAGGSRAALPGRHRLRATGSSRRGHRPSRSASW